MENEFILRLFSHHTIKSINWPSWKEYMTNLFYLCIMEREATDHGLILLFCIHRNGAVVVLLKNIPVSNGEKYMSVNNHIMCNINSLLQYSPEHQGPFLEQRFIVLIPNLKQQVKKSVHREAITLQQETNNYIE